MITWKTKNINIQDYYKIMRRIVMLNGHDGTSTSGYKAWKNFKDNWRVTVIPTGEAEDYKQFYSHLTNIKVSDGIAWGVTGKREMVLFVVDSNNPFITRSNVMPIGHELLHAIYQDSVGTFHITRKYDSPEGKAGTTAAAATVIVHDNWYGNKITLKIWISWGVGWIPLTIPFIPIKQAKKDYAI